MGAGAYHPNSGILIYRASRRCGFESCSPSLEFKSRLRVGYVRNFETAMAQRKRRLQLQVMLSLTTRIAWSNNVVQRWYLRKVMKKTVRRDVKKTISIMKS